MIKKKQNNAGVVVVIGFILLLGILSTAVILYSSTVAPELAQEEEYDTTFTIISDFEQLRTDIDQSSQYQSSVTTEIQTNVQYPPHVSPFTTPMRYDYQSENATVEIDGSNRTQSAFFEDTTQWETERFNMTFNSINTVRTDTVGFEHGLPSVQSQNGSSIITSQTLISGKSIRIYLIETNLGVAEGNRDDTITIDSTPFTTTTTDPDGNPVEITLETRASESAWNSVLEPERTTNGGYVSSIDYTTNTNDLNTVKITMESNVQYDISIGRAIITNI